MKLKVGDKVVVISGADKGKVIKVKKEKSSKHLEAKIKLL